MEYCKIGFGKKVHIVEHMGVKFYRTWTFCGLGEWEPEIVPKPKADEMLCKNCVRIQAKDRG